MRYSSAIITRAPWLAAMRAARTPPDPPPMTNRSVSKSAMWFPAGQRLVLTAYRRIIVAIKVRLFLPRGVAVAKQRSGGGASVTKKPDIEDAFLKTPTPTLVSL